MEPPRVGFDDFDAALGEPREEAGEVRAGVVGQRVEGVERRVDCGAVVPVTALVMVHTISSPTVSTR